MSPTLRRARRIHALHAMAAALDAVSWDAFGVFVVRYRPFDWRWDR